MTALLLAAAAVVLGSSGLSAPASESPQSGCEQLLAAEQSAADALRDCERFQYTGDRCAKERSGLEAARLAAEPCPRSSPQEDRPSSGTAFGLEVSLHGNSGARIGERDWTTDSPSFGGVLSVGAPLISGTIGLVQTRGRTVESLEGDEVEEHDHSINVTVSEIFLGLRFTKARKSGLRPYVGLGLARVFGEVHLENDGGSTNVFGVVGEVGIHWRWRAVDVGGGMRITAAPKMGVSYQEHVGATRGSPRAAYLLLSAGFGGTLE